MIDPLALRRFVYDEVIDRGLPPRSDGIATRFGVGSEEARDAIANLKIGKAILPHPKTGEIWMVGPFAAAPTPYVVRRNEQRWFANCAWDMIGVATMLNTPVQLDASCVDCGDAFSMSFDPGRRVDADWIVHFLVPAAHWYDDVGFT